MRKRILGATAVALLASASLLAGTGQAIASTSATGSQAQVTGGIMWHAGIFSGAPDGSGSPECEAAGREAVASGEADDYTCTWLQSNIYDLYLIDFT